MHKKILLIIPWCLLLSQPLACMEPSSPSETGSENEKDKSNHYLVKSDSSYKTVSDSCPHQPSPFALMRFPLNAAITFKLNDRQLTKENALTCQNLIALLTKHDNKYYVNMDDLARALLATDPDFFINNVPPDYIHPFLTTLIEKKTFVVHAGQAIDNSNVNETLLELHKFCETIESESSENDSKRMPEKKLSMAQENAKKLKDHIQKKQNIFQKNYKKLMASVGLLCITLGAYMRPYLETCIINSKDFLYQSIWEIVNIIKGTTGK